MKTKTVLPESSWVKIKASTEEVDGSLEILLTPIAACLAFDRHDLAVEALGHSVGDRVAAVGQNVGHVIPEHGGNLLRFYCAILGQSGQHVN